jgi:Tfp pilus assembly protein PilO
MLIRYQRRKRKRKIPEDNPEENEEKKMNANDLKKIRRIKISQWIHNIVRIIVLVMITIAILNNQWKIITIQKEVVTLNQKNKELRNKIKSNTKHLERKIKFLNGLITKP